MGSGTHSQVGKARSLNIKRLLLVIVAQGDNVSAAEAAIGFLDFLFKMSVKPGSTQQGGPNSGDSVVWEEKHPRGAPQGVAHRKVRIE